MITNQTHTKNRILLCVYIFRSLPYEYIQELTKSEPAVWEKTRLIIVNLVQQKFITKTRADCGISYLRLTRKGHIFVGQQLLKTDNPFYTFRRGRSLNHPYSNHHFYNFATIWHFLADHGEKSLQGSKIYEDSNLNAAKVRFHFKNRQIVLSPDVLVFLPDKKNDVFLHAKLYENDTGGETLGVLQDKLIEYALLAKYGLQENSIRTFDLKKKKQIICVNHFSPSRLSSHGFFD